jgi:hypothetical protein
MATDIVVTRGCYTVATCTATENGSALNITGAAIYFAARTSYPLSSEITDTAATMAKSTANDIAITNGAGGVFTITFDKADTNTLSIGTYVYGIEYVPQGETDPRLLQQGNLTINPDIVRAV